MLLERKESRVRSVRPDFNFRAMNEVAFRPDDEYEEGAATFDARMERIGEHLLNPTADGPVQAGAEQLVLHLLEKGIAAAIEALGPGDALLIDCTPGRDWPKTRERRKDVIVDGENRFHFHWRVEPPLRLGIYRERTPSG